MPNANAHGPEPWRLDSLDAQVVVDQGGEVAAVTLSKENARRVVAAINSVAGLTEEALEAGIVARGLECLRDLCRYHLEDAYRAEIDARQGAYEELLSCGKRLMGLGQPSG